MELGATVCTPASPSCDRCPARSLCASARRGDPESYPLPKRRPVRKPLVLAAVAAVREGRVLLQRRVRQGLFGGLWELPCRAVSLADPPDTVRASLLAEWSMSSGVSLERHRDVRQALTHRDVTVQMFRAELPAGAEPVSTEGERRWVAPEELPSLGLSSLMVKSLEAAGVTVPAGHGRRRSVRPQQPSLF